MIGVMEELAKGIVRDAAVSTAEEEWVGWRCKEMNGGGRKVRGM